MSQASYFTSPNIASTMEKAFGNQIKKVDVDIKYKKEIEGFIKKVDQVHVEASNSKTTFR